MSKTIVNLTMPFVVQEIEDILEQYPHHPYQEAFANPDFRQNLIAYTLNRIPNHYLTVDEQEKENLMSSDSIRYCLEQTVHIEAIIHQGIEQILSEKAEEITRHIPDAVDPSHVPSDWFG
ncbi:late competence development ComFB family protein [Nostoc sp. MG11]|uniref:late competence development ComFB family protein n=1 Tax=Nostoc sp. MG11 TaxID=2721166 RepID=UPI0018680A7B|nr:late competence development ComFB family protein [Nostoc sp. MG11]